MWILQAAAICLLDFGWQSHHQFGGKQSSCQTQGHSMGSRFMQFSEFKLSQGHQRVCTRVTLQSLTCKRCSGVSNSFTRPSSSTRILSESKMLCSRCAIVSTVQSAKAALTVSCMRASLAVSTLLVASSRTRTLALRRRARAMHSSCLWPELRLLPASPSTASNPPYKREGKSM